MPIAYLPILDAALDVMKRGGWVMVPIFLTGLWAWMLIMERTFVLWWVRGKGYSSFWIALESGGLNQGKTWLHKNRGLFAELSRRVMQVHHDGSKAVHNEVERITVERLNALHKYLKTINCLSGIAPLLGLLGTVSGIVHTFSSIQESGFGNPAVLANGISEALLATQSGLLVAFPIAVCYNFVLKRVERLEVQAPAEALRFAAWLDRHPQHREPT
jgi:biopolymer transport protein ExbB